MDMEKILEADATNQQTSGRLQLGQFSHVDVGAVCVGSDQLAGFDIVEFCYSGRAVNMISITNTTMVR